MGFLWQHSTIPEIHPARTFRPYDLKYCSAWKNYYAKTFSTVRLALKHVFKLGKSSLFFRLSAPRLFKSALHLTLDGPPQFAPQPLYSAPHFICLFSPPPLRKSHRCAAPGHVGCAARTRGLRHGLKIRTPQVHLVRLHIAGRREVREGVQITVKGKLEGATVVIGRTGKRRTDAGQHGNIIRFNSASLTLNGKPGYWCLYPIAVR